jgi:uncharacterized protein YycO
MAHLEVVYARNRSLLSVLIRNADRWGRWSHCGVLTPQGTVIEARFRQGVVETHIDDFLRRYSRVEVVRVDCLRPARAQAFAAQQLGKPYDWRALFGNLLRATWERVDAWQCTELVEAALVKAGRRRFRGNTGWRISPNQSYMVK